MGRCAFVVSWVGYCGAECPADHELMLCEKHAAMKCVSCGSQATHDCDHTGQFVCGHPLCESCEGGTDPTKPSGAWGFANHIHRRKGGA